MRATVAPRVTASAVPHRARTAPNRGSPNPGRRVSAAAGQRASTRTSSSYARTKANRGSSRSARHVASKLSASRDDLDFDVDEDNEYPGMDFRSTATAASSESRWAVEEEDISISPSARAAAAAEAQTAPMWSDDMDGEMGGQGNQWNHDAEDNGWSERRSSDGGNRGGNREDEYDSRNSQMNSQSRSSPSWANEDIIADSGQDWFENDEDWYEPEYAEVNAPPGSILEKVQRLHLKEPKDYSFQDGEYFDLTGFVKDNTDNQFALVLEIAERARERKVEHLESLNPVPASVNLPPIQQAIVDLALEIEASGGKTSAFSAMREAADRARLRWELQEAAWALDNYCEDRMEALGVSERAARLLHMGQRVEDAMDFEKDLNMHEDDYNAKPPRSGLG